MQVFVVTSAASRLRRRESCLSAYVTCVCFFSRLCHSRKCFSVTAQHADHKGTHFVTSFLDINSTAPPELRIISQVARDVNVTITTPRWSQLDGVVTFVELHRVSGTKTISLPAGVRMRAGSSSTTGACSARFSLTRCITAAADACDLIGAIHVHVHLHVHAHVHVP